MKISTLLRASIAAAATAAVLSGCATETANKTDDPAVGSNASGDDDEAVAEDVVEEEPEAPANLAFGDTATYPNGLEITISKPKSFKPTEYSSGGEDSKDHVKFTVTIVNGTKANFDQSMVYATLQSSDAEAEEVYDTDAGLDGSPMTKVLPGRQSKFDIGFGIEDPKDLVLELSTGDYEQENTIFTN